MRLLRLSVPIAVAVAMIAGGLSAVAVEILPPERAIEEVVDHYVDAGLEKDGIGPAPAADDGTLIRRLTLDLAGRIPTAAEARAYVGSEDSEKRVRLVDRLMRSPGFVRYQADAFDTMLMAGVRGSVRDYLVRALREDRPWDRIFREILAADEAEPGRKGASEFLKPRAKDLDLLTNDVSSVFFGVNVSCAKCHDHPKVKDWKQDHFFGLKSFFGRTSQVGNFVAESDFGAVKFKTTAGEEKQARFQFLSGRTVDVPGVAEPSKEVREEDKKRLDAAKKKKVAPLPPKVSARARLAEVALLPGERDFFARSIANRLWQRFHGVGLVMPLDQMHSANPPSHPELLAWLARDTIEHGYDLRRLIRGLVLSRAYARTSRWESAEPPGPRLFAVAAVRPLSPMQLATSLWLATEAPETFPEDLKAEDLDRKIEGLEGRARDLAQGIARPGEDYQIGAAEALLMSNGDRIKDLLSEKGDRLVSRVAKATDPRERVNLAVRNVLSRPPEDEESAILREFLAQHADLPVEGARQLIWSLLTSAEFRFNY